MVHCRLQVIHLLLTGVVKVSWGNVPSSRIVCFTFDYILCGRRYCSKFCLGRFAAGAWLCLAFAFDRVISNLTDSLTHFEPDAPYMHYIVGKKHCGLHTSCVIFGPIISHLLVCWPTYSKPRHLCQKLWILQKHPLYIPSRTCFRLRTALYL